MNKALFLDRDGIINVDHGYIYQPEQMEFVAGIFELCQRFAQQGYLIIVVTNQSGIARGLYSEADFAHLSQWMTAEFSRHKCHIAHVYYCPHHPQNGVGEYLTKCACRKPQPGMLLSAKSDFNIDLNYSVMVGDKASDMQAAQNAGVGKRYLLQTGQYPINEALEGVTQVMSLDQITCD